MASCLSLLTSSASRRIVLLSASIAAVSNLGLESMSPMISVILGTPEASDRPVYEVSSRAVYASSRPPMFSTSVSSCFSDREGVPAGGGEGSMEEDTGSEPGKKDEMRMVSFEEAGRGDDDRPSIDKNELLTLEVL